MLPEGTVTNPSTLPLPTCRPPADFARFGDARIRDPFRFADRQPGDVEAAVAVEVEDHLFERRWLASAGPRDVEVALEGDRGEAVLRQVQRLEVGVQLEPDFARFHHRRGAGPGGEGGAEEGDDEDGECPLHSLSWQGEVRSDWRRLPSAKISLPWTWSRPPEQPASAKPTFFPAFVKLRPKLASARIAAPAPPAISGSWISVR